MIKLTRVDGLFRAHPVEAVWINPAGLVKIRRGKRPGVGAEVTLTGFAQSFLASETPEQILELLERGCVLSAC